MRKWTTIMFGVLFVYCSFYGQQLKPLDGVRVTIFNIPESVTGEYFVLENNTLQLPFLGPINNDDKNYETIKEEISSKYQSIYREPELVIEPLYRITILGEVRNPGAYFVTGVETVTDIIGLAGGETQDADLSEVIITRDGKDITVDLESILEEGNNELDLKIKPADKLYVTQIWFGGARNTSVILSALAVVVAAIVTVVVSN